MHDSSGRYARLALEPRPSRRLALMLAGAHAAAVLCLWLCAPPPWLGAAGTAVLAADAAWTARRARAAVAGVLHERGRWCLVDRDGVAHPARLCPDSYVHPQLVILNFRLEGGRRRSVVLLRDSLPADALRRLRVVLRTAGAGAAAS